jgi:hypothetical protein
MLKRIGVIIFCLVWFLLKKIIKFNFFLFKKTKTGSNRPVSVRFGFLGQKPVQTGLAQFFRFGLVLARFFSSFFSLSSVRFFWFQAYKTETEPVGFFKILIGFFHGSVFSVIVFPVFST